MPMGIVDAITRSLGSISFVDDLDDSSTDTPIRTRSKRTAATAPAAPGYTSKRTHRHHRDKGDKSGAEGSSDGLKRENRSLKQRVERLEKDVVMYKRYAEHYRDRRRETERERSRLEEKNKELETIVQNMKEDYEKELQDVRELLSNASHASAAQPQPQKQESIAAAIRAASSPRQQRPSLTPIIVPNFVSDHALERRLAEREEEIRALRLLLDETDELSSADLTAMIKDLNGEIAAFSSSIVDGVEFGKPWEVEQAWVLDAAEPFLERCLQIMTGPKGVSYSEDPTLVQLAVQSYVVKSCNAVFDRFLFGLGETDDQLLDQIYEHLRGSEPQVAASRWRALARMHVKALQAGFDEALSRALHQLEMDTFIGIESILRFAGSNFPPGLLVSVMAGSHGVRLEAIFRSALRLAEALTEKIVSACVEVYVEEYGRPFEDTTMESVDREEPKQKRTTVESEHNGESETKRREGEEDILRDGPNHAGASVVCSIGFGLRRVASRRRTAHDLEERGLQGNRMTKHTNSEAGSSPTIGPGPSRVVDVDIILKTKVLMSSTVDILQKRLVI